VFGRRRREEAAAEAAREEDRLALFARLAERPEHICPFLGLASERTGYVDGVSDEHRCYAFGDPAPLSAEQQTRVCQERGYGNCPRYLRGVLVIPTEELEALRRPRPAAPRPASPPPAAARPQERRRFPLAILLVLLLAIGAGGGVAYLLLGGAGDGIADATPTPVASASREASPSPAATSSVVPSPSAGSSAVATPTPEPTPIAGDEFAFYEVSLSPGSYELFRTADGQLQSRRVGFDGYSFAEAAPARRPDDEVWWVTQEGALTGWAYEYPASGSFRIRAVFFNGAGERRSYFLETAELTVFPTATPAPEPSS
jgi:hypothetical protein